MKRCVKIVVDVLMLALFPYLMFYHPGMGLLLHALIGIGTFLLFIAHHLLNMNWYKTLFRGRWGARRILLTCSDTLLFLAMLLMMLSSFMISGLVFDISFLPVRFFWRDIHVFSCAWGFLLMAFHLGLHLHGALKNIEWKLKRTAFEYVGWLLELLIFLFGVYAFWKNGLAYDMLIIPQSNVPPSGPLFYTEYIGIIMSVCLLTHGILSMMDRDMVK